MSDTNDKGGGKGFGGLQGLSSRNAKPAVEKSSAAEAPPVPPIPPIPPKPELPPAWQAEEEPSPQVSVSRRPPIQVSQTAAPESRGWLVAVFIVGGLLFLGWLTTLGNQSNSSQSNSSYPASSASSSYPSQDVAAEPEVPAALPEVMAPVGSGNVLSTPQIRYCVFQDVRVKSAEKLVDSYNGRSVDHFNSLVNDFNSRCSYFQYRQGALAPVEREAAENRVQLEEEGRQLMSAFTSAAVGPSADAALTLDEATEQAAGVDYAAIASADAAAAAADAAATAATDAAEAGWAGDRQPTALITVGPRKDLGIQVLNQYSDIVVSINSNGSSSNAEFINVKLMFEDGQTAGEQSANNSTPTTTYVTFKNENPWPRGRYDVEVTINGVQVGSRNISVN